MRLAAAEALGSIGVTAAAATPELFRALQDDDSKVREAAVGALHSIMGEAAIPKWHKDLKSNSWEVRQSAAWAFRLIGEAAGEIVVPELRSLLDDENSNVRLAAAQALISMGCKARSAIPHLRTAIVKDSDPNVRCTAAEALRPMGELAFQAVPELQAALRDEQPAVRRAAALSLKSLSSRKEAAKAVPDLCVVLTSDEDRTVREHAAWALGYMAATPCANTAEVIEVLRARSAFSTGDREIEVRKTCAAAVKRIELLTISSRGA